MSKKKKIFSGLSVALVLLSGCSANGLINLPSLNVNNAERVSELLSSVAKVSRQRVKVSFYNRLSNDEIVPLVPEALDSLTFNRQFSIDSSEFPANKGLEQVFPFIEAGEHLIEIVLKDPQQIVQIPLVVTNIDEPELRVLVILAFDSSGKVVNEVQVGYDQNNNLIPDAESKIYLSSDGFSYLIYRPDGQVETWVSPLTRDDQEYPSSVDAPLPPGSEKESTLIDQLPPTQDGGDQKTPPPVDVPPIPEPMPLPLPEPGS